MTPCDASFHISKNNPIKDTKRLWAYDNKSSYKILLKRLSLLQNDLNIVFFAVERAS